MLLGLTAILKVSNLRNITDLRMIIVGVYANYISNYLNSTKLATHSRFAGDLTAGFHRLHLLNLHT